jgi:feruloyl esterase
MTGRLKWGLLASACLLCLSLPEGVQAAGKVACEGLSADALGLKGVKILSAKAMTPGKDSPVAHCLVEGATAERTGADGKPYAIHFEMRLPDDWNGRFVHQFNGGNDGAVLPAFGLPGRGDPAKSPLAKGFAVLSSDAGHDGKANPDAGLAGSNMFGLDPEARDFYGYKAVATLTPMAKALIKAYYGAGPQYSYGVGCSNGGRHGFVTASRLGKDYDGILAGDPGFNLPTAAIQHALDIQQLHAVNGDVRKALTPEDQQVVAQKIVAACDKLDGLEDGIVSDFAACQKTFDPESMICAPGQNSACLPAEKVKALMTMHDGPKNSKGEQLYSDWSWDPGIGGGNWRFWKIESQIPPWDHMPLIAVMGAGSLAQIFTTPPTKVAGDPASLEKFLLAFDFDKDAPKIFAKEGAFGESAMSFMTPPDVDNPKLADFEAEGHKMIVYHGVGDPVFSFNDTRNWYDRLNANYGGGASKFVEFYPVPGMTHCEGGPATDQFNLFEKLVGWVEQGEKPADVVASLNPANKDVPASWPKDRTRKLCPYPQVARYTGGNPEEAASFTCQ